MSSDVQLPDDIAEQCVCGCFREDIQQHDGVYWAYTKTYGFHSPFEEHPPDEVVAARLFLGGNDEGTVLA
jgi:hypothetical protein